MEKLKCTKCSFEGNEFNENNERMFFINETFGTNFVPNGEIINCFVCEEEEL